MTTACELDCYEGKNASYQEDKVAVEKIEG